uniref:Reverse transcriptase domain-containing protein n=1 Tax=Trichogramma kaykai TaxID=54128 RepID=A0ABD2W6P4_9HYME
MKTVKTKLQAEFSKEARHQWANMINKIDYRDSANFFPKLNACFRKKNYNNQINEIIVREKHIELLDICKIDAAHRTKVNGDAIVSDPVSCHMIIGEFFSNINSRDCNDNSPLEKIIIERTTTLKTSLNNLPPCTIFNASNVSDNPKQNDNMGLNFTNSRTTALLLRNMSNKTSSGHDEIPNIILKKINQSYIKNYTIIFNNCLNNELDNLRPLSLLPLISKVFERTIKFNLANFCANNKILPDHQFGFRHGHATTHAIHKLTADINWNLLGNKMTGAVLIDIKKAFDSVWHDGLLFKLCKGNMDMHLLKIINSMITDKKFKINGLESIMGNVKTYTITKGLQQGTVNSPLLFNIFTADLLKLFKINQSEIQGLAFADDLIIYTAHRNMLKVQNDLQDIFTKIIKYYNQWKLQINPTKCETILFRHPLSKEMNYTMKHWKEFKIKDSTQNIAIPHKREVKYLGIILDDLLKFNAHSEAQINKAKKVFAKLSNLFHSPHLSPRAKIISYLCLIRPILISGCPIWFNLPAASMEKLRLFERKVIRICLNKYKSAHSNYTRSISNVNLLTMAGIPRIDSFIVYIIRNYIKSAMANKENNLIYVPYYEKTNYLLRSLSQGFVPPEGFKFLDERGLIIDHNVNHSFYYLDRNYLDKSININKFNLTKKFHTDTTKYDEIILKGFSY